MAHPWLAQIQDSRKTDFGDAIVISNERPGASITQLEPRVLDLLEQLVEWLRLLQQDADLQGALEFDLTIDQGKCHLAVAEVEHVDRTCAYEIAIGVELVDQRSVIVPV